MILGQYAPRKPAEIASETDSDVATLESLVGRLLLGSWQNEDGSLTVAFQQDGTFLMAQPKVPGDQPIRARYTSVDNTHLKLSFGSESRSVEVISISPQELVIRDWDGQIGKFRKMM